jgi:hypothetical protein
MEVPSHEDAAHRLAAISESNCLFGSAIYDLQSLLKLFNV